MVLGKNSDYTISEESMGTENICCELMTNVEPSSPMRSSHYVKLSQHGSENVVGHPVKVND